MEIVILVLSSPCSVFMQTLYLRLLSDNDLTGQLGNKGPCFSRNYITYSQTT